MILPHPLWFSTQQPVGPSKIKDGAHLFLLNPVAITGLSVSWCEKQHSQQFPQSPVGSGPCLSLRPHLSLLSPSLSAPPTLPLSIHVCLVSSFCLNAFPLNPLHLELPLTLLSWAGISLLLGAVHCHSLPAASPNSTSSLISCSLSSLSSQLCAQLLVNDQSPKRVSAS